ncbi:MAG TPA: right-handed parallel beta-helix repeat-containing protein [Candidatus Eisenbacteria bacterium]|nr:right-handed parallel beta-helix repeat-containing protein [Candidatus Eisenbacteria bacterium]
MLSTHALAVLLLSLALCAPLSAATYQVPLSFPNLRTAITAATSGDTIVVAPGTWDGGAFVNGKTLTIASRFLATGDTTFIGQTVLRNVVGNVCSGAPGCSGNAILEFGDAAAGSRVVGLTIQDGENGIAASSPVDVIHCRVLSNGDGIDYVTGSGGTIRNSVFAYNSDDGIDLNGRMNCTIQDNIVRDNQDDGIEYRLYAWTGAMQTVSIKNNRITGNGEVGIQLIDYPPVSNITVRIENNFLSGNYNATGLSAAVSCMPDAETIESLVGAPMPERIYLLHNTIVDEKNGMVGGANVIALNNLFKGIEGKALRRVGGSSIASYNLFWGNGVDYEESVVDAAHVITGNPLLNASGALTAGSAAINAGTAFFQWGGSTVLNEPANTYAGNAPDLGAFEFNFNTAPSVNAGADMSVRLDSDAVELPGSGPVAPRADALVRGTVVDDGLPSAAALSAQWVVVSGPGPVVFQQAGAAQTRASLSVAGTYVLRLTGSDGAFSVSDTVVVTVLPEINTPPVVDAGHDRTLVLPTNATQLHGTVVDDGRPMPSALTVTWTKASGAGTVSFQNPNALDTQASFSAVGVYVLRFTASDGALSGTDSVQISVQAGNQAPVVNAGPNQTITLPASASLDGTVTDDGLPAPPALTTTWSKTSGPGTVTFQNANAVDTQASFSVAGTYFLRLNASDGALSTSDTVRVTVLPVPNTAPVVNAGPNQTITLPASAVLDGTVTDDGLPAPPTLSSAWSKVSGPGSVVFQNANLVDTQASFGAPGTYDLRLTASDGALIASDTVRVTVLPVPNTAPVVDAGPNQIITLPAGASLDGTVTDDGLPAPPTLSTTWSMDSGPAPVTFQNANAVDTQVSFTVEGTYFLRLTASDGVLTTSDTIRITVLPVPNAAPVVDAGPDQTKRLPWGAALDGTVSDDGKPAPPALVTTWSLGSGPAPVSFQNPNAVDTQVSFTVEGTYVLRLTASDGQLGATDSVQITVLPLPLPIERRISAASDDAEERGNGHMSGAVDVIELVQNSGQNQTVGFRFIDVQVPAGAIVTAAYLQFEAAASDNGSTSLVVRGQAADNPSTFSNADNGVSSRPRTSAQASWSPPAWNTVGQQGAAQRTTELKTVVQEIVDRSGWSQGNAMAFIITGSGLRTAKSREGSAAAAAMLHVEYFLPEDQLAAAAPAGAFGVSPEDVMPGRAVTVLVPKVETALHGTSPQPSRGSLTVAFSLAGDAPATLELLDVAGRRIASHEVGTMGAGRHEVPLRGGLPAGIYMVRLTHGQHALTRKAIVIP